MQFSRLPHMKTLDLADLASKKLLKNVTGGARFHPEWKRRQVGFSRNTRRKLTALAKDVSKKLGYQIFPMQLAGLIVEAFVEAKS